MIYTKMTNLAIIIAYNAHHNQFDKNNIPYIFHPYHIAEQMDTEDAIIVALLHDVLEDTNITLNYLTEQGFSKNITDALNLLTHNKNEDYYEYIRRIKTNPLATKVKIADLIHNSDMTRLKGTRDKDILRLEKYKQSLQLLKS